VISACRNAPSHHSKQHVVFIITMGAFLEEMIF